MIIEILPKEGIVLLDLKISNIYGVSDVKSINLNTERNYIMNKWSKWTSLK